MLRFSVIMPLVSAAVLGSIGQCAVAQPPGNVLSLPRCPNAVFPIGHRVRAELPGIGAERTIESGEPLAVSDDVVVLEQELTIRSEVTLPGRRGDTSFIVTIPPGNISGVDVLSFMHHVTEQSYHLANACASSEHSGQLRAEISGVLGSSWVAV